MKFTLKPDERLRKKNEIIYVLKRGKKIDNELFSIYFLKSDKTKVAVSTKKNVKKAVRRNRSRRKMKEILRLKKHLLKTPAKLLLVVKKDLSNVPYKQLEKLFLEELKKINDSLH